jgi:hypothetical protein
VDGGLREIVGWRAGRIAFDSKSDWGKADRPRNYHQDYSVDAIAIDTEQWP